MKTKVELDNKSILVTGGAGFIGANLILRLLKETTGSTMNNEILDCLFVELNQNMNI